MNVPPVRAVFPLFVTFTGNAVEVVSVNQLPKFSELGDTVATKVAAEPVPLSGTGEPVTATLAAIVRVPANDPEVVGAKTTLIVHVEAAFNVPPHVPPAVPIGRENGAVAEIVMPVRLAVPTLCNTSC